MAPGLPRLYRFPAFCLVVLACGLWVRGGDSWDAYIFIESTVYFSLLALLAGHGPTHRMFVEAPALHRGLVTVIAGALVIGQLADNTVRTYPLAHWRMYSNQTLVRPRYTRFIAVLEGGSRIPLPIGDIPTQVRPFVARLEYLAWQGRSHDEAGLAARRVLLDALRALAREHEAAGAGPVVREVVLERCDVALDVYRGRDSIQCKTLQRFSL